MGDTGRLEACSTSTMMLFGKEFEDFHDDDFDGSVYEHEIFTELLFGSDSSGSCKRCLVTGMINFESDCAKQTDLLFGSNNESSVLTSRAESSNVIEDSTGVAKPGVGCLAEDLTMSSRSDHDVNSNPMKLSVEELSDAKPSISKVSDTIVSLKEVVSSTTLQPSDFGCQVTCCLVESWNQGITSSCYLLKQNVKINKVCELAKMDISKYTLSSTYGSERKEMAVSKTISSPVSQESYMTKLLVYPSITAASKSGTPRPAKRKWKNSCFVELDEAELSIVRDSHNDPRPLLRHHVHQLLRAAGWVVGRRKRTTKLNGIGEYIFKSPDGRPIREFRNAWISCGEHLLSYANNVVPANDCKIWTDMTQFRSDLSSTVTQVEEQLGSNEPTSALACTWCLLDPFANVVFIDKTIRLLKEGKPVKAKRSLVTNSQAPSGSCLVSDDALTICEEDQGINEDQSGEGKHLNFGGSQRGIIKHTKCRGLWDSVTRAAAKYMKISSNEGSILDTCSLPACGSHSCTYDQTGTCLFEVPFSSGNAHTSSRESDDVCPHQDGNTSSNKDRSDQDSGSFDRHFKYRLQGSVGLDSNYSKDGFGDIKSPNTGIHYGDLPLINISKGKSHKKSKRISEIRLTSLYQNNKFGFSISQNAGLHDINDEGIPHMSPYSSLHRNNLKQKRYGIHHKRAFKKSKISQLKDNDLLISAIIKNKAFKSTGKQSICKSKAQRKRKNRKGSCRLVLRSLNKGGKQFIESKWSAFRSRTVMSWLIHSGVVSINEVIYYRNPKDNSVVKHGLITWEGILCKCCNKMLSVSEFKKHAGFRLNRPCLNLFTDSGKPLTLCQLEAWSAEYQARKGAPGTVQVDEVDQNDDICGRCGDGGELICCDNCPSTFHQACLNAQELPEGNWYCPHCTCRICGNVVNENEGSEPPTALTCSQCEHKYHEACMEEKGIKSGMASDTWFCGESCLEVYSGLQSRIGLTNFLPDGFSWTLLRCIHGDQKVHSAQRYVALKAECNSKLAVALTIMEECFLPMVDPRTGIDLIPHVVYNWGSQFARLNYYGFYTVVLEKDDTLMSVASVRIHGVTVAEMPLIATCSKYRRQGMCRHLMNSVEEMLKAFKVEKLVISAIPSLVETWTAGFGFRLLEDDEKRRLSDINLMVFPGTVWLKKPLCDGKEADHIMASHNVYVPTEMKACYEGTDAEPGKLTHQNMSVQESDAGKEGRGPESENLQVSEGPDPSSLDNQILIVSSEEPHLTSEEKKPKCENLQASEGQDSSGLDNQLLNLPSDEPDLSSDENKQNCENLQVSEGQGPSGLDNQFLNLSSEEPHSTSEEKKPESENLHVSEGQGPRGFDNQLLNLSSEETHLISLQISEGLGSSGLDNQLLNLPSEEPHLPSEEKKPVCVNLLVSEDQDGNSLDIQLLKLSSEEPDSSSEDNKREIGCHLESLESYDEKKFCLDEGSQNLCIARE